MSADAEPRKTRRAAGRTSITAERPGFAFAGSPDGDHDTPPPPTDERPPPKPVDHRHGHRQRLRERFDGSAGDDFPDYELLELLLFRSVPRQDTKVLAKALISRFGSFAEVLSADPRELVAVEGVGETIAFDLRLVAAAARRFTKIRKSKRPILSSWSAVLDYCRTAMAFKGREEFRLLFLDKRNALLADEVQQVGTVDHTPVYPREVMRRALELQASAVILAHNHPSGDPTPSRADIEMTRQIAEAGQHLGISVHDHLIIGRNGHTSLKALGLF